MLALPEKEGLGKPISTCLLSTKHQTLVQDFTLYNITKQENPKITSLFLVILVYESLHLVQQFGAPFYLLDWMLPNS